jgi:hypothetical protein
MIEKQMTFSTLDYFKAISMPVYNSLKFQDIGNNGVKKSI